MVSSAEQCWHSHSRLGDNEAAAFANEKRQVKPNIIGRVDFAVGARVMLSAWSV